uniref:Uncharacterized protein n=1 Tax=Glossina brevipalpis TaxID=37001 RepID=A0A1A9W8J4_9MUSC
MSIVIMVFRIITGAGRRFICAITGNSGCLCVVAIIFGSVTGAGTGRWFVTAVTSTGWCFMFARYAVTRWTFIAGGEAFPRTAIGAGSVGIVRICTMVSSITITM